MQNMVIIENGKPTRNNDGSIMLQASARHCARVVEWLGYQHVQFRPATDAEIAEGSQTRMHQRRKGEIGQGW